MRESRPSRRASKKRHNRNTPTTKSLIIRGGSFEGKKAELRADAAGDWVRIAGETVFCVKDGHIKWDPFLIDYDERDLLYVYELLRKKT